MKFITSLAALGCCLSSLLMADNKVLVLDSEYGIVYDEFEWKCENVNDRYIIDDVSTDIIKGTSRYQPVEFQLLKYPTKNINIMEDSKEALAVAKGFLSTYSITHKTLFSNLTLDVAKKTDQFEDIFYIVRGSYFDDNGSGRFAFYMKPNTGWNSLPVLSLFIKINAQQSEDKDNELFHTTFELIHSVVSK